MTEFAFGACRFNEFGVDGGSAAKALKPKFNVFSKHLTTHTGFQVPILRYNLFPSSLK
ncbi:putative HR-like lesion-inducer [Helianthus debilis subsp. tardiflorus]